MNYVIMAISINPRTSKAPRVQEILTNHGCIIKTRLGLHDASSDMCSQNGIILLQLRNECDKVEALRNDLSALEGVKVNTMEI